MFTNLGRSRPRRSSRFVPTVDGLAPRLAPVTTAPLDYTLIAPPPAEPAPTTGTPEDGVPLGEGMADLLIRIDRMCRSTPADV